VEAMIFESVTGQLNSEGEIIKKLRFYFMNYFSLGADSEQNGHIIMYASKQFLPQHYPLLWNYF